MSKLLHITDDTQDAFEKEILSIVTNSFCHPEDSVFVTGSLSMVHDKTGEYLVPWADPNKSDIDLVVRKEDYEVINKTPDVDILAKCAFDEKYEFSLSRLKVEHNGQKYDLIFCDAKQLIAWRVSTESVRKFLQFADDEGMKTALNNKLSFNDLFNRSLDNFYYNVVNT